MHKFLICEDDKTMRDFINEYFSAVNIKADITEGYAQAAKELKTNYYDALITDMKLNDGNGIDLIEYAKNINEDIICVIITAYGTKETVIKALSTGAYDFIAKPFTKDALDILFEKLKYHLKYVDKNKQLKAQAERKYDFKSILGTSEKLKQVFEIMGSVINNDMPVLITGESGTGKELIAKEIHYSSKRQKFPFIAVNCGAIPENLIESELFGYKKGAFTGADADKKGIFKAAHNGTVFLDEIAELPLHLQVKILRAIETQKITPLGSNIEETIDIRIISATNKNLENLIKKNQFREDLFYRLNVIPIHLPPLRDRKEDILLLAEEFLKKECRLNEIDEKYFTQNAKKILISYEWPGNIRELENLIKRTVVLIKGTKISSKNISEFLNADTDTQALNLNVNLLKLENELIQKALAVTKGNKTKAARLLSIKRTTLLNKMSKK